MTDDDDSRVVDSGSGSAVSERGKDRHDGKNGGNEREAACYFYRRETIRKDDFLIVAINAIQQGARSANSYTTRILALHG